MKRISLKALAIAKCFNAFSKLRMNSSSYWYVTLLCGKKSFNIYLSKNSTAVVNALGLEVGSNIPTELLKNAEIVLSINANQEERYKLSFAGSGDYLSSTEMSDIFGVALEATEFDINAFKAQFEEQAIPVGA